MKLLVILGLALLPSLAFSQGKAEISAMLDQLKAQGMFSASDIEKAKAELGSMKDSDINALKLKAQEKAKDPEFTEKLKQLQNSN